jgi:hypothetical protein
MIAYFILAAWCMALSLLVIGQSRAIMSLDEDIERILQDLDAIDRRLMRTPRLWRRAGGTDPLDR